MSKRRDRIHRKKVLARRLSFRLCMDKRYAILMVIMNILLAIFTILMYQNAVAIAELKNMAYDDCHNYLCRFGENVTLDCPGPLLNASSPYT